MLRSKKVQIQFYLELQHLQMVMKTVLPRHWPKEMRVSKQIVHSRIINSVNPKQLLLLYVLQSEEPMDGFWFNPETWT
ncbi:MAG: hypothetical protein CMA37_04135 [Euryarchaeota archaeon]|nr:hypothetical protein [Euryarchaeota archaeon]